MQIPIPKMQLLAPIVDSLAWFLYIIEVSNQLKIKENDRKRIN